MPRFRIEWSATKLVSPGLDPSITGKPLREAPALTNTGGWLTIEAATPEDAVRHFKKVERQAKILSVVELPPHSPP